MNYYQLLDKADLVINEDSLYLWISEHIIGITIFFFICSVIAIVNHMQETRRDKCKDFFHT